MTRIRLGVNIDHVATIRNARGADYPDPARAAIVALEAGADGITAHLREDRRHISDTDIDNLSAAIEPILIVAIGLMVLVLALGVFLPMWDLSRAVRG